jgi:hypothetical protein
MNMWTTPTNRHQIRRGEKGERREIKTEMIERVGENLAWLGTLEEEIAKLR